MKKYLIVISIYGVLFVNSVNAAITARVTTPINTADSRIMIFGLIPLQTLLISSIFFIFILLIIREIVCWYWKINTRLKTQERMLRTLIDIQNEMKFITDYIKRKDSSAQKSVTPTEAN